MVIVGVQSVDINGQFKKGVIMTYSVEEVKDEPDKRIAIRLKGDDISFIASSYSLSIYIDEKTADSIAFHIQAILEDRKRFGRK